MATTWTFGRKVGGGFAISVIALLVVGAMGYHTSKSLIANDEAVAHSHLVRRQLAILLLEAVNAETGQRGFVIAGKDEFLEPYNTGVPNMEAAYAQLRTLTADNPNQQRRLDEARGLIDARLREMTDIIAQRRTSAEAAIATISTGAAKHTMDALRRVVADMDAEEATLLETRRIEAEESTRVTTAVILWGSIGAIVLTVLVGWLITGSLTKQIGGSARNLQSSAAELQAAANQQASGATEQATAMTEVATTISELLATSRQIAESSQRVAHIASETAMTARTGIATVGKGNDAVATVRRQVDLIVTHMGDLGRKSQQVGSVLDIVQELAEQTNILAINATIEAAGAGESGRRFGVVADEIRDLADRVGASTKEIRTMIEDVRGAVNSTVMVTEAGSKAVDAGAMQVAEMASAFTQIASLVATTTDAAREIELSTKQQATAVEQVNEAITSAAQATRESEASTAQTLQTSRQLTNLSTQLTQIVQST
jgi:methyl-accepting chemotaxis protein